MIDISDDFKKILISDNLSLSTRRKFKLSFYNNEYDSLYPAENLYPEDDVFPSEQNIPWLVIENDRIESESLVITESLCDSSNLEFGSCETAELEIVVADILEDLTGKEFFLTEEIGEYQMPLGYYIIESFERQSDRRKRKITAYNRMRLFNSDVSGWYNGLDFPISIREFRDSLSAYIGIQQVQTDLLFDSVKIEKTINPSEISGLNILKSICQLNAVFGYVDKNGLLKYVQIQQTGLYPSETLYPYEELYPSELGSDGREVEQVTSFKSLEYEDAMIDGIDGLKIMQQNGELGASVGEQDNVYTISGNFLVYGKNAVELLNMAQSLLPYIYGRTYRPCVLECPAMPWIEPGDALRIVTRDDVIETLCMKRTLSGCQAMMDTIESTADDNENVFDNLYDTMKEMDGKSYMFLEQADKIVLTMDDLSQNIESQLTETSSSIKAEVKRATESEEKISGSLTQTESDISSLLTESNSNLQSQIDQNSKEISLKVSQNGLSAQISQESGSVSITGNRFSWEANNSSMTSDGTLTCKGIVAKSGTFNGTVSGTNISGSTIDGVTISGTNINAKEISAAKIDSTEMNLESLNAVQLNTDDEVGATDNAQVNIQNIQTGLIICKSSEPSQIDWVIAKKYSGPIPKDDSDARLKKNIQRLNREDSSAFLEKLNPVFFEYKKNQIRGAGLIAQEVEACDRKHLYAGIMYQTGRDGFYRINYTNYIGMLISGIQDMSNRIERLKAQKGE